jgi:hypothetical protein
MGRGTAGLHLSGCPKPHRKRLLPVDNREPVRLERGSVAPGSPQFLPFVHERVEHSANPRLGLFSRNGHPDLTL